MHTRARRAPASRSSQAASNLGQSLLLAGQPEPGIAEMRRAIARAPTLIIYRRLGMMKVVPPPMV